MRDFRIGTMLALVVVATVMTGCSKKQAPPPAETIPPPAETTTPEPVSNDTGGTPIETPPPTLEDVFFDYDQYALRDDSRRTLDANAEALKAMADWTVTLEGHCDERGTVEYNLALGEKRARAAKDYLVSMGVGEARLSTISYGEERPFELGHDESAWSMNRRVHFRR